MKMNIYKIANPDRKGAVRIEKKPHQVCEKSFYEFWA